MDHSAGHPKFCLRFIQSGFDVQALDRDKRADFALTLQQRAALNWNQLQQSRRMDHGYEWLPREKFSRAPIPAVFGDQERFMVFRYSGNLPMAGVRAGDTFHVLWIERHFNELYTHDGKQRR